MISFGQLEANVRVLYEAESTVRWKRSDFLKAANDGLDELSEGTGFYERFTQIPLKGRQTYYDLRGFLPPDIIRVNSVWNSGEQIWLDPVGVRDLMVQRWETVIGSPRRYLMRGINWLGVYPRPESDTNYPLLVYYAGHAPHFQDTASIVADIPDDFIPALEDYILYDLSAQDGETSKSLLHWSQYRNREKGLAALVKGRITTARSGALGGGPGRFRS